MVTLDKGQRQEVVDRLRRALTGPAGEGVIHLAHVVAITTGLDVEDVLAGRLEPSEGGKS